MDLVVGFPDQFDVAGILNGLRCVEPLFKFIQQFLLVAFRDRLIGDISAIFFFIAVCGSVYCLLCGSIPANTIKMLAATSSYSAKSLKPFFLATCRRGEVETRLINFVKKASIDDVLKPVVARYQVLPRSPRLSLGAIWDTAGGFVQALRYTVDDLCWEGAPVDVPGTPNLTWTVTKPVAAGAQIDGFTATTAAHAAVESSCGFTSPLAQRTPANCHEHRECILLSEL
jgi:hypothetical protein